MPTIKDRIKDFRRIKAKDLAPNPANWREHPTEQRTALSAVLSEIGWADALLARETPNGLQLIDGHLRATIAPEEEVPVLIVDVNEEEANTLLATLDPLSALATTNQEKLADLLDDISTSNYEIDNLLSTVSRLNGLYIKEQSERNYDEEIKNEVKTIICPNCKHEFPQ